MTVIFWRLIETFRDLEVERSVYVDLSHRSSFSFTNPQMRGKAGKAGMVKDKQIFDKPQMNYFELYFENITISGRDLKVREQRMPMVY